MNLRSARGTVVAGVAALLVIAAIGWLLLISPARGQIAEARAQQSDAQDTALLLQGQLAQLTHQVDLLPRVHRTVRGLATDVPRTADESAFLRTMTDAAHRVGIEDKAITTLDPSVPVPVDAPGGSGGSAVDVPAEIVGQDVAVQTVTLTVEADYGRLTRLLGELEQLDRAFLVRSASLASAENDFTLTVTGSTFVAPPVPPLALPQDRDPPTPHPRRS